MLSPLESGLVGFLNAAPLAVHARAQSAIHTVPASRDSCAHRGGSRGSTSRRRAAAVSTAAAVTPSHSTGDLGNAW